MHLKYRSRTHAAITEALLPPFNIIRNSYQAAHNTGSTIQQLEFEIQEEQLQLTLARHAYTNALPLLLVLPQANALLDSPLFYYLQCLYPSQLHLLSLPPANVLRQLFQPQLFQPNDVAPTTTLIWLHIPPAPSGQQQEYQHSLEQLLLYYAQASHDLQINLSCPVSTVNSSHSKPRLLGLSLSESLLQESQSYPALDKLVQCLPLQLHSPRKPTIGRSLVSTEHSDQELAPYLQAQAQLFCPVPAAAQEPTQPENYCERSPYIPIPEQQALARLLQKLLFVISPNKFLPHIAQALPIPLQQKRRAQCAGDQTIATRGWQWLLAYCQRLNCPWPEEEQEHWNAWAWLQALACGCSDLQAIYLAAPADWQNYFHKLEAHFDQVSTQKQALSINSEESPAAPDQSLYYEFQPIIQERFQFVSVSQFEKLPFEQHTSIRIYDNLGNASAPYSCKRLSPSHFQVINPYLGYQVGKYHLTGQKKRLEIEADSSTPSLSSQTQQMQANCLKTERTEGQGVRQGVHLELAEELRSIQFNRPISDNLQKYFQNCFAYSPVDKLQQLSKTLLQSLEQLSAKKTH